MADQATGAPVITSLSVGAVFTIEDRASAVLERLAAQMENLDRLITRTQAKFAELGQVRLGQLSQSLAGVERRMGTIAASSERMGTAMVASTEAMTAGLVVATEQLAAMAVEMRGIASASRLTAGAFAVPAGGGAAGRGGGGGHRPGGIGLRAHEGPFRAHTMVGPMEAVGIGAGLGVFEGLRQAAEQERAYRYAIMAGSVLPDTQQGQDLMRQMREQAAITSRGTIFSRTDIAKMMPGIAGMADVPLPQVLPLLQPAIWFGEFEKQLGATLHQNFGAQESAAALVRYSHLVGITNPAEMAQMADLIAPVTQTGEVSPARLTNILQYMTSQARGVGMTARETVQLAGVGSILFPGTRAGTNIGWMLQQIERAQAGVLPGMSKQQARHIEFLRQSLTSMGLIDPKSHQLFRDREGSVVTPLLEHLQSFEYTHPGTAAGIFQDVFGTRGARAAFELGQGKIPGLYANLAQRETDFAAGGGIRGFQLAGMNTAINQIQHFWSQLKNVLTDLADPLLPHVTSLFRGLATALEGLDKYLLEHRQVAGAAGTAATIGAGLTIGALARRFFGGGRGGGGLFGGGGAAGAAARGAAGGVGLAGLARAGGFGPLAGIALATLGIELAGHVGETQPQTEGWLRSFADPGTPMAGLINRVIQSARVRGAQSIIERNRLPSGALADPMGGEFMGRVPSPPITAPPTAPTAPTSPAGALTPLRSRMLAVTGPPGGAVPIGEPPIAPTPALTPPSLRARMLAVTGDPSGAVPIGAPSAPAAAPPSAALPVIAPAAAATPPPGAAPAQIINNHVTLNVSVQGVTMEEIVQKVIAAVKGILHTALVNNSGPGAGHLESPYTSGAEGATFP